MGAPRNSTKARRICFETHLREDDLGKYMICHICDLRISFGHDRWEADHIRRHAEGGEETANNLWPAHEACHKVKSAKDTTEVAKGKRVRDKTFGIKKSKRPMPGSRASGFKRKMNGTVERRK